MPHTHTHTPTHLPPVKNVIGCESYRCHARMVSTTCDTPTQRSGRPYFTFFPALVAMTWCRWQKKNMSIAENTLDCVLILRRHRTFPLSSDFRLISFRSSDATQTDLMSHLFIIYFFCRLFRSIAIVVRTKQCGAVHTQKTLHEFLMWRGRISYCTSGSKPKYLADRCAPAALYHHDIIIAIIIMLVLFIVGIDRPRRTQTHTHIRSGRNQGKRTWRWQRYKQ